MNPIAAKKLLVSIVKPLAAEKRAFLDELKREHAGLERPDFLWHYLLQSFSTMGRASGWQRLIANQYACRVARPCSSATAFRTSKS